MSFQTSALLSYRKICSSASGKTGSSEKKACLGDCWQTDRTIFGLGFGNYGGKSSELCSYSTWDATILKREETIQLQTRRAAPYIRSMQDTQSLGLYMVISLVPLIGVAIYEYQISALLDLLITTGTFAIIEFLFARVFPDEKRVFSLFSIVEGISIAIVLPANLPHLYVFSLAFIMAFLGKQILEERFMVFITFSQVAKLVTMILFPAFFTFEESSSVLRLLAGKDSTTLGDGCIAAIVVGFVYLAGKKWPKINTAFMILGILLFGHILLFPQEISILSLMNFFFSGGLLYAILFSGINPKTVPASFQGQITYAILISAIILTGKWFGFGAIAISFSFVFMNAIFTFFYQPVFVLFYRRKFIWKE